MNQPKQQIVKLRAEAGPELAASATQPTPPASSIDAGAL
jgi:hypothetical protein